MGFDVTAAHVIFLIALVSAGSAAMGAYWTSADHLEEARRIEDTRAEERVHTNMTILTTSYNAGANRFSVDAKNVGSTVIDISDLVYLVDGAYISPATVESVVIQGAGPTDLWLPMETLQVQLRPITASPTSFMLVADNGVSANWRS